MDAPFDTIAELLTTRFGVPANEINADATFSSLDLDSLALVEFLLVVQQEFGITVSEDEVSPDDTVEAVVALIASRKALV
jgi:acyl carrier protein